MYCPLVKDLKKLLHTPGIDYNHYSIETFPDERGYACAGTLFDGVNTSFSCIRY